MGFAFEITGDDIDNVLCRHGQNTPEMCGQAHDICREAADRIEDAALCYTKMSDQTESAYDEIESILIEEGFLAAPKRFRAP